MNVKPDSRKSLSTFNPSDPLPFEDAWTPWIASVHRRMSEGCSAYLEVCTEGARADLLRRVLEDLHEHVGLALQSDFSASRTDWMMRLLPPALRRKTAEPSREHYARYVQSLLDDDWTSFAKRYPVAVRVASGLVDDRVAFFSDFLGHLVADRAALFSVLNEGRDAGAVASLKTDLSDPHNGGRGVVRFDFEGGLSVIYKPRSYSVDRAWERVLDWLGERLDLVFRTPAALDRDDHCWVERIQHEGLERAEDAAGFYRASGILLAALYVLGGSDFHQENLVACGSSPILIDLETLLRPLVRPFAYDTFSDEQKKAVLDLDGDSVLRTCMLPMWMPIGRDMLRDYGALSPGDDLELRMPAWADINTDDMRRAYVRKRHPATENCPHLNGRVIPVLEHKGSLLDGFRDAYGLLMKHRAELAGTGSPWLALRDCVFRFLPRNTQIYADMSRRLRSGSLLRGEEAFAAELDKISRPFRLGVPEARQAALEPLARLERNALARHDIPVVLVRVDDLAARHGEEILVDDFFLVSGWGEFLRRLEKLSEDDLTYQADLISSSLSVRYPEASRGATAAPGVVRSWREGAPLSDDELLDAAGRIAGEIADRVMMKRGMPMWLTRKFDPMTHLLNIGPSDAGLYEGVAGIGLCLAAVGSELDRPRIRELAGDCFLPLKRTVESTEIEVYAPQMSLGYGAGIGGMVLAAREAGRLLGDLSLCAIAEKALSLPLEAAVDNDRHLDIMGGVAGGILSLLPFVGDEHLPGPALRRIADLTERCGEHLLAKRFRYGDRLLWPCAYSERPLTGFAHGAAGYARALLELHRATGRDDFKTAALDAIGYERDVYVPSVRNWPDYRVHRDLPPGGIAYMAGWCSGAPGIGLARLCTLDILDTPEVRADIENALAFTLERVRTPNPEESDHYCCGVAGRADFLLEAARRLHRPELLDAARASVSFIVRRSRHKGRYTFNGDTSGPVFSPGLFTGLAGLAWVLWRAVTTSG